MRIPRKVQIAARTYVIRIIDQVIVPEDEGHAHESDALITHGKAPAGYDCYHIYVGRKTDELRRATTFLHELIHGVDLHYLGGSLDEGQVDALAEGLMQAIRGANLDFRGEDIE